LKGGQRKISSSVSFSTEYRKWKEPKFWSLFEEEGGISGMAVSWGGLGKKEKGTEQANPKGMTFLQRTDE